MNRQRIFLVHCFQVFLISWGLVASINVHSKECRVLYPYDYFIDYNNGGREDLVLHFNFYSPWDNKIERWIVIPSITVENFEISIPLFHEWDGRFWTGKWLSRGIGYDPQQQKIYLIKLPYPYPYSNRPPWAMQILTDKGEYVGSISQKLTLEFKKEILPHGWGSIRYPFGAKSFNGTLQIDSKRYTLTEFKWVEDPKGTFGSCMLQAEIGEEIVPTPPPATETLFIISAGNTMRDKKWFGPAKEAVLKWVSETETTPPVQIAVATGTGHPKTEMEFLMKNLEELAEAKKRAAISSPSSDPQHLVNLLKTVPEVIQKVKLTSKPRLVMLISTEWSFFGGEGSAELDQSVQTLLSRVGAVEIVYLAKNENDVNREFDEQVVKHLEEKWKISVKRVYLDSDKESEDIYKAIKDISAPISN